MMSTFLGALAVLLIAAALFLALSGFVLSAGQGVALVGLACLAGIFARMVQAEAHRLDIVRHLSGKAAEDKQREAEMRGVAIPSGRLAKCGGCKAIVPSNTEVCPECGAGLVPEER